MKLLLTANAGAAPLRKWSRAVPGEALPQRRQRLQDHREHQGRQKARRLARLDSLLDLADAVAGCDATAPAPPCGSMAVDWEALPAGCDPCGAATKMRPGKPRGERKRESVSAMAWLLSSSLLHLSGTPRPTIVDAGCGTGSLLLPLAALFTNATFVGVDTKRGSLERLVARAADAGPDVSSRVVPWHGRIEDYDGACDCLLSLHACGGASDAALRLAAERAVPFAVSPCCIGKLRRGPASEWLRAIVAQGEDDAAGVDASFSTLAAWADSEHVAAAPPAPSVASLATEEHLTAAVRRQRCKALVERDRLEAVHEQGGGSGRRGRVLRITGRAMATSGQTEVLSSS